MVEAASTLQARREGFFDFSDAGLVAPVEGPTFDALGRDQLGLTQNAHVFAQGGLRDAKFFGEEDGADTVFDEVAINLGAEVGPRIFEPMEDLKAAIVGESLQSGEVQHIVSLPNDEVSVNKCKSYWRGAAMSIERIQSGARMSQVVIHNQTIYLAGQVASGAPGGDVAEQTKDILSKIDALLAQARSDKSEILSATIWLTDMSTFGEMNGVWESWVVAGATPARATVTSPQLASPEFKVEISIIAMQS
jgi:enamine deaminase RidA (YjgF/YER057c/UK114 family)